MGVNPFVTNVEQQLNTWRSIGVIISDELWEHILQQADAFDPVTNSDEPLVTGGFGYNNPKVNYIEDAELRYAPGMKPTGALRLVHFDPNAYAGLSPEVALKAARTDKVRLASIEVLEHEFLFHSRWWLGFAAYDGWSSPTVREC